VDAKVARGQTVDPTVTAYEVADLSTVWVMLRVFERDLASVRKGDRVEVIPQGAGAHPLEGTVDHVGVVVAEDTRTAPLRIVIENKEGALRPGQSVHARIHVQGPVGKTLVVPRAAISRVDGKPTVLLMVGPGTVEPRAIELGAADHDEVAVLDGLKEGDAIVEGGLFALKSEIFR
jgi:cobalt-zinc-cadmium efflux system membrane fusion protein